MADAQAPRTRYRSIIFDSGRWDGFAFRPGDVVISTPPKSGTTWTQMLCALLIFDGPTFPAPLEEVSPGLDICTRPLAEVTAALAAQTHRRFIKTHAPLDGLPRHAEATYLVVGRDPRDVAISWEHHAANMDFARVLELRAAAVGNADLAELPEMPRPVRGPGRAVPPLRRRRVARRAADAGVGAASPRHGLAASARPERRPLPLRRPDRPTSRGSCSAWRASSGSRAHRNARVSWRRRRAWPGCASARPTSRRARRRSAGRTCAPSSAAAAAASGARASPLPTSPRTRHGSRQLVGPDLAAWAHGGRLASGVDPER